MSRTPPASFDDQRPPPAGALVLVVEDDDDLRGLLAIALEEEGYRVQTACNGREALALLPAGPLPSVIITDIMMPVMDGWDLCAELKLNAATANIPLVVMTATGFSAATIQAQFGQVDLLMKPVELGALVEVVRRLAHAPGFGLGPSLPGLGAPSSGQVTRRPPRGK